mmetsp:Transcript_93315/g.216954  ORF Transcript_93315/g.216954 Transcript_93315/m.216954 type:complete len:110 (-) Transcript_93315:904-1233(-)
MKDFLWRCCADYCAPQTHGRQFLGDVNDRVLAIALIHFKLGELGRNASSPFAVLVLLGSFAANQQCRKHSAAVGRWLASTSSNFFNTSTVCVDAKCSALACKACFTSSR